MIFVSEKAEKEDKDFVWREQKSRTPKNKPAKWNVNQLMGKNKKEKTPPRAKRFVAVVNSSMPAYTHMMCSLESGFANERDFAINAAAMLTVCHEGTGKFFQHNFWKYFIKISKF